MQRLKATSVLCRAWMMSPGSLWSRGMMTLQTRSHGGWDPTKRRRSRSWSSTGTIRKCSSSSVDTVCFFGWTIPLTNGVALFSPPGVKVCFRRSLGRKPIRSGLAWRPSSKNNWPPSDGGWHRRPDQCKVWPGNLDLSQAPFCERRVPSADQRLMIIQKSNSSSRVLFYSMTVCTIVFK